MGLYRLALWIVFSGCLILPTAAVGKGTDEFRHAAECGAYALVAVAKALEVDVDVADALASMSTSVVPWSTSLDIGESANKLGLWSVPFHGVTASSLRYASRPMVILLKTEMKDECAGHWVAYLGDDQGQARIFDNLDAAR